MSPPRPYHVLIAAPSFPPAYKAGGPARTLEALVAAAPDDARMSVITTARDVDGSHLPVVADRWIPGSRATLFYASTGLALVRACGSVRTGVDVLYLNSFFNVPLAVLPQVVAALLRRRTTVLLAPRGELDPGALAYKARKKRAFLTLHRTLGLSRRVIWHASSELEASNIRAATGSQARILVRENETSLARYVDRQPSKRADGAATRLVFVGRISPKKGLLTALRGLCAVDGDFTLDVYGPHEDAAYLAACREEVEQSGLTDRVRFHGPLAHEDVVETFARHDFFVFPTAGENFGHVIAESLAAGCAVVTTDTTPWTEVLRSGGGRVVPGADAGSWRETLQDLVEVDAGQLDQNRQRTHAAFVRWAEQTRPDHVFELVRRAVASAQG